MEVGLDYALANPEKSPGPLPADHPMVEKLRRALEQGRALDGESQETAGFRQAEAIMEICNGEAPIGELGAMLGNSSTTWERSVWLEGGDIA